ncbi:ion transporter [Fibrobacter sp.]|uniref:ion transporter n=1 Tax=Fibrobacter sp. TaxID=35828 RepID=UPI0025C22F85|nr:ion transporter [Fibrobacter sp.]MBR3072030.1 ion transporter [Fibrobacter sp.]
MQNIVESRIFRRAVFGVILFNAVILGLETSPQIMLRVGRVLDVLDKFCLGFFVIELICRLIAYRTSFFKSGWNIFDFAIIVCSLITTIDAVSSMRVVRLFRELQAVRLISSLKTMQIIVNAILKSIPSLAYTTCLMLVLYYVYAVIGVSLFCETHPEEFGSLPLTMLTLFQLMTFDGWATDLMRPMMELHPCCWIYFVSFVILSAILMLNIVVGIAVNFVSDAYSERMTSQKKPLKQIAEIESLLKNLKESLK